MRRLHAGLAGLGLVFLITGLGALALSGAPQAPAGPSEPLAELGVAPAPRPQAPPPPPPDPGAESPVADRAPAPAADDLVSI